MAGKNFPCDKCNVSFRNKWLFKTHKTLVHNESKMKSNNIQNLNDNEIIESKRNVSSNKKVECPLKKSDQLKGYKIHIDTNYKKMNDFIKEHGGTIVQNQKDCNFVITKNIHKVRIALKDEIPWFDPTNDSLKLIETANGVFSEDCLIDYFVKIKSEVPFVGRKFKNSSNVCYINALLNGLMSLQREGI